MKKSYLGMMLGAVVALGSFTSCDEDDTKGMVLSGEWEGQFGMYYEYQYKWGDYERFFADYTYLDFVPYSDSYKSGYGYQVDFYDDYDSPYSEIYHSFTWQVKGGTIYLTYRGEREWDTFIRDYQMSNSELRGYFEYTDTRFSLRKVSDYYDWTPYINDFGNYNNGYGYGYYYRDGYYAKTRSGAGNADEPGHIVRYGNRYVDNVEEADK